ncbi:MAG: hypothetical protein DRJ33_04920 [Candidatus Methanomethylicota archaeon]|uniref:Uncharacterized protein n=1 Tax=Thermoproteota archaeon TaxID=2056631 RepID=A0A497EX11_9CREN|nr:MAG: hypothetical protein DRJ33_04920 [Candidatus Verstraetearchaeota archaeon]
MPVKLARNRYVVFKLTSLNEEQEFSVSELFNTLQNSLLKLYGEVGASEAKLKVIPTQNPTLFIAKCSHKAVDKILTAASHITSIDGKNVIVSPVLTTGTMKKIREKLKTYLSISPEAGMKKPSQTSEH